MPSLFSTPRWDRAQKPINWPLSRQFQEIHNAVQETPLFTKGVQVIPGGQRQVSLQTLGTQPAYGPAMVGSPSTLAAAHGKVSHDPERNKLIAALSFPSRGWSFGPSGGAGPGAGPSPRLNTGLFPPSSNKPVLSGGIPKTPRSPISDLQVSGDPVPFQGFAVSPTGEIAPRVKPLSGLAGADSLGSGAPLEAPTLEAEGLSPVQVTQPPAQSKFLPPVVVPRIQPLRVSALTAVAPVPMNVPGIVQLGAGQLPPVSAIAAIAAIPSITPIVPFEQERESRADDDSGDAGGDDAGDDGGADDDSGDGGGDGDGGDGGDGDE